MPPWKEKEIELLKKLGPTHEWSPKKLQEFFPGRTYSSIYEKIARIQANLEKENRANQETATPNGTRKKVKQRKQSFVAKGGD